MRIHPIVRSQAPILFVGGGKLNKTDISDGLALCSGCVAVDGGLSAALQYEVLAVIGDMDSALVADIARVPSDRVHHVSEQDTTDFEKAIARVEAPVIVAVGFCGGRIDHQLAALHVIARFADRPCVLVGKTECMFIVPKRIDLNLAAGDVVSLMPLAPVTGRSDGLRWPIEGLAFDPLAKIGTSNEALGSVTLEMDAPHMIAVVPRTALKPLVASLLSLPDHARWPARVG